MKDPVTPLAAAVGVFVAAFFCPADTSAAEPSPVVVELFTSQGCNSCPPADALLGELARDPRILALSLHVTYWDRLGWPDTFGLEAATRRQDQYAGWLGLDRLYTPQMVIGGRIDVVGSSRRRVAEAIELLRSHSGRGPALTLRGHRLRIGAGDHGRAAVWLMAFDDRHDVDIARGENRGRSLRYHQVVRDIIELAMWDGSPIELELPLDRLAADGRSGAAVLVQRVRDGVILAAVRLSPMPG